MKYRKSAVCMLACMAATTASAQSSVTVYGVVDVMLSHGSGSVSGLTSLGSGGTVPSQLGFKGVEDLGGGNKAAFNIEAGFNADSGMGQATNTNNQSSGSAGVGGLNFNRQSWLSLAGQWGELRLGRDYTPQFRTIGLADPFGVVGTGVSQTVISPIGALPTSVWASNSIAYMYNTNGWGHGAGVFGTVMHYLGENAAGTAASKDGTGTGVLVGYNGGAFTVEAASSRNNGAAGDTKQNNVAVSWNAGVATLTGYVASDRLGDSDGRGYLLGAQVPVGAGSIRASYSQYRTDASGNPATKKLAVGYVHSISKRTALYANVASVKNSGGAAQSLNGSVTKSNGSSKGLDLGIRHSF